MSFGSTYHIMSPQRGDINNTNNKEIESIIIIFVIETIVRKINHREFGLRRQNKRECLKEYWN